LFCSKACRDRLRSFNCGMGHLLLLAHIGDSARPRRLPHSFSVESGCSDRRLFESPAVQIAWCSDRTSRQHCLVGNRHSTIAPRSHTAARDDRTGRRQARTLRGVIGPGSGHDREINLPGNKSGHDEGIDAGRRRPSTRRLVCDVTNSRYGRRDARRIARRGRNVVRFGEKRVRLCRIERLYVARV
jgi:hypothetical protein